MKSDDWVPPDRGMDSGNWPPKPGAELFNNCYRLYLREQLAAMADLLGRTDEARTIRAGLTGLRPIIHAAFYDQENQRCVLDEQSYYLKPLMTGVVPEALRPRLPEKLEECIRLKRKGHLDTPKYLRNSACAVGGKGRHHGVREIHWQDQSLKFLRMENNAAVYEVGSGICEFRGTLEK